MDNKYSNGELIKQAKVLTNAQNTQVISASNDPKFQLKPKECTQCEYNEQEYSKINQGQKKIVNGNDFCKQV